MDSQYPQEQPVKEKVLEIIEFGTYAQALKAINILRDHWPSELPPFVSRYSFPWDEQDKTPDELAP